MLSYNSFQSGIRGSILLVFLSISAATYGSHIAGGEFQMHHLAGYSYEIKLILYFDKINGAPGAKDPAVLVKIFRNSDDSFISNIELGLSAEDSLLPTYDECSNGAIIIGKITYSAIINLPPDVFDDDAGYYLAWERCCRSLGLTNIVSDSGYTSNSSGQTFFLHFPAVTKGGVPFINSAPTLIDPTIDYACPGLEFYMNYAGEDVDGDSLVYSIATPLATHTVGALPEILPKPYPEVTWRPPFNLNNITGGVPDLKVSGTGLLTVKPSIQGLFQFAIKCEEYRSKIKIGEFRREYQFLVVDACQESNAPDIMARSTGGSYSNLPLDISFDITTSDEDRCVQVRVTDVDINSKPNENIYINAIPIGFTGDVSNILPSSTESVLTQLNPNAEFSICFNRCPLDAARNFFTIGVVAYDKSCSIPLTDTVKINVVYNLAIGCLEQSITFPPILDKTYGDEPFLIEATASSGLPIDFSISDTSIASASGGQVTILKPGRIDITALQSGDEIYRAASPVTQKICIKPQPPELTLFEENGVLQIRSSIETGNLWFKDGEYQNWNGVKTIPILTSPALYTARAIVSTCVSIESNSIVIGEIEEEPAAEPVTSVDKGLSSVIQVFPNPVTSHLEIRFIENDSLKTIELYSVNGQRLFREVVSGKVNFVNVSDIGVGIYFLKIGIGESTNVYRIIRE